MLRIYPVSRLQDWTLGHDCRRVSTHRPTQLNSTQHVQFSVFFTKSVGSRRDDTADADELSRVSVGDVYWA